MDFGFDLVDAKIKDRKRAEMIRDGKNPDTWKPDSKMPGFSMGPAPSQKPETVEKLEPAVIKPTIDENTTEITNIVYARDPTVLDPETKGLEVYEAFQHTNYLDVKNLVRKRELLADEDQSPRAKAHLRLTRKVKQQFDRNVYKLSGPEDRTLLFESRFECGNLYLA
jgi:hypothetical protein